MWRYDAAEAYALTFQDSASPVAEEIVKFHNYVMIYMTVILFGVMYILGSIIVNFNASKRVISHKYMIHGTVIEFVWTVLPAVVLVFIGFPSFKLLYLLEEVVNPALTIKVIGHQWYWSYEYSDYATQNGESIGFDSYMVPTEDLEEGDLRLLEVDSKLVIPANTHIRVVVTSADVLHSWAVPSLGAKMDCVPGRLNQIGLIANREGTFYGQCSELCGANHAFMPIVVEAVSIDEFCSYIGNLIEDN